MASANGKLPPDALAPIAGGQLAKNAAAAWNSMNVESRKRGLELLPNGSKSSYRDFQSQQTLWRLYQSGKGSLAAVPGESAHGWGQAVDVATHEMRSMIDAIGARYGWQKQWSDAQSEWWHLRFEPSHFSGPDVGPYGRSLPIPEIPEDAVAIHAVVKQSGAIELFLEKADGSVWHTWQTAPNSGWWGGEAGKQNAKWQNLNAPK